MTSVKKQLDETQPETQEIIKSWYERAKSIDTPAGLVAFMTDLAEDYQHDYGTTCHAAAASALAAAWAFNNGPGARGGMTGFQASCTQMLFVKEWSQTKGPGRLIDYGDLLYPQYEYKFTSINSATLLWVREEAKRLLAERLAERGDEAFTDSKVVQHWKSIAGGAVPFGLKIVDH